MSPVVATIAMVLALLNGPALAEPIAAEPPSACAYLAGLVPVDGGPLFLPSYPTVESGPLHGVAFLYDNAAAAIALIGCGEAARARRIGDAMLAALDHDRFWQDGRLRNGYAAGLVRDVPVRLSGWWDPTQNRWLEDSYQVGSDSGNMAWAMLALLALNRATDESRYRDGAVRIGNWVAGRADDRGAGGFTGGFAGWEPMPSATAWKSTEHNTDLAAAFAQLSRATGDAVWADRAVRAQRFVAAMWDGARHEFAVGVTDDGVTRNPIIALDAEIWPLLAIPGLAAAHSADLLPAIKQRLGGEGFYAYSEAEIGVWTEGTAQAALFARLLGDDAEASALLRTVDAQRAPHGGYFATDRPRLATGFTDTADPGEQRYYYRSPHLGAAAWAALAESGFNPFTGATGLP